MGRRRSRVISWNGIVTYGAMAMGAPLGVLCFAWGGLQGLALTVMGVALLALPRPSVKTNKGNPLSFRAVLGRVWLYGMALALASAGFGVIATFIALFYDAKGWDGAAFALTLFSVAFVGVRLPFPKSINMLGVLNVAMIALGDHWSVTGWDGSHAVDGENRRFDNWYGVFAGLSGAGRGGAKRCRRITRARRWRPIPCLWIYLWGLPDRWQGW